MKEIEALKKQVLDAQRAAQGAQAKAQEMMRQAMEAKKEAIQQSSQLPLPAPPMPPSNKSTPSSPSKHKVVRGSLTGDKKPPPPPLPTPSPTTPRTAIKQFIAKKVRASTEPCNVYISLPLISLRLILVPL